MRPTLTVTLLVLTTSCLAAERSIDLARLEQTRRVDVRTTPAGVTKSIEDVAIIQKVVAFAKTRQTGWRAPWYGTPIGRVALDFYGTDGFLGHLGIGEDFLETQQDGFFSRSLKQEEREDLIRVLDVAWPAK
jgi:hypothetical protein